MTLIPGLDAAMPPTLAQAQEAYAAGYRWCGFYPRGVDGDEDPYHTWSPADAEVLRQAGLAPVAIWVPDPNLASNPTEAAQEAYAAAQACGLKPTESVLYTGNHLENTGEVTGGIWIPKPGPQPSSVGPLSAVQDGQTTFSGWSVDTNVASTSFPMSYGLVFDFEYNTTAGQAGVNWYKAAQAEVAKLGAPPAPTPPNPSPTNHPITGPEVAAAATPSGKGYWLVNAAGGVSNHGDAGWFGDTRVAHLNAPVVGIARTPSGNGYWLAAADGGVFTFGDARFYGSAAGVKLAKPVTGIAAAPDGNGYWLFAQDEGVFSFGDASFEGAGS